MSPARAKGFSILLMMAACGPSPDAVAADSAAKSAAHFEKACPPRSPDGKFDRGCAAAAMGSVNTQQCKRELGPTGSGRVEVIFAPDGPVVAASLVEGPFADSDVGACVLAKFRAVHVPAFDGPAVHVKKAFSIE